MERDGETATGGRLEGSGHDVHATQKQRRHVEEDSKTYMHQTSRYSDKWSAK
jgi:hypothetical protein